MRTNTKDMNWLLVKCVNQPAWGPPLQHLETASYESCVGQAFRPFSSSRVDQA